MIEICDCVFLDDIFFNYKYNDELKDFHISMVEKYWPYLNQDDLDGLMIMPYNDDFMSMVLRSSKNNDGIVLLWDCENEKIVHLCRTENPLAFDLYDDYIVVLCALPDVNSEFELGVLRVRNGINPEKIGKEGIKRGIFEGKYDDMDGFVIFIDENNRLLVNYNGTFIG